MDKSLEIIQSRLDRQVAPGLSLSNCLPDGLVAVSILRDLRALLYPGYFGEAPHLMHLREALATQCEAGFSSPHERETRGQDIAGADAKVAAAAAANAFVLGLPEIKRLLSIDVAAAYARDPASRSVDEVILCYPGVLALTVHRLANLLWREGVPILPRMWNQWALRETGIDIHPGATIGEGFFVDHGTGVVIGETTLIGRNCTVYQGVTLGAARIEHDAHGKVIRGSKRHPTLEDSVTVYANATVLGGATVIGAGCIINGGLFVTESVPPGHIVRGPTPELILKSRSS